MKYAYIILKTIEHIRVALGACELSHIGCTNNEHFVWAYFTHNSFIFVIRRFHQRNTSMRS